jgi:hypothetical protein
MPAEGPDDSLGGAATLGRVARFGSALDAAATLALATVERRRDLGAELVEGDHATAEFIRCSSPFSGQHRPNWKRNMMITVGVIS